MFNLIITKLQRKRESCSTLQKTKSAKNIIHPRTFSHLSSRSNDTARRGCYGPKCKFHSTSTAHETTDTAQLPSGNHSEFKVINRFTQPEWLLAEIFNLLPIFCVTWICLGLTVYGFRTGKWLKENRSSSTPVNAGAVYTAAVAAYFFSLFRLIPDQVTFNLGYGDKSSKPCESAMNASIAGYVLTIVAVSVFLCFRQRSIYQHFPYTIVAAPQERKELHKSENNSHESEMLPTTNSILIEKQGCW